MRARSLHLTVLALTFPLTPAPRASTCNEPPLKVFVLAGQSNMVGAGAISGDTERNGGQGSLEYVVRSPGNAKHHARLLDENGGWTVRDDVWVSFLERKGGLTAGFGSDEAHIGPELGFGHVVGDHLDETVLLIKVAWGGKSLAVDYRPPSAGGEVGPCYRDLTRQVHDVLSELDQYVPEYEGQGYELVGFGWHQGWNDRVNQAFNDEYEANLAHFIRDIRRSLAVDSLPFVIAETGMSGHAETHPRALSLMRAQAAVAEYEEFQGNVAFVGTRDFYRAPEVSPSSQGYHWNSNAETYLLIGEAMGRAMVELMEARGTTVDRRTYLAGVTDLLDQEWPDNRTVNIVCHGHSVPAGYFATPAVETFDAYPHLLHRGLKARHPNGVLNVIVTAIGGEASESGARRFGQDVLSKNPDVVTLDYGLNDRRLGLERARVAWCSMIEEALAANVRVILLTPTADQSANLDDPEDPLILHAEQIRQLARRYGVALVDSLRAFQAYTAEGGDLVDLMSQVNHPNRAGHDLVVRELLAWFPE